MKTIVIVGWCLTSLAQIAAAADVRDDTPARPEPLGPKIESVLKRVTPSVVSIWYGANLQTHVTGTIISPEGLIVTCEHISAKVEDRVEVRLSDGRKCEAKVLSKMSRDKNKVEGEPGDLALVQLAGEGPWPVAEVGTVEGLAERDQLLAIGYPSTDLYGIRFEGLPRQVRLGHRYMNLPVHADVLPTSIRGRGGDSGGPVFDLGGRLVGTCSNDGGLGAQSEYMSSDLLRRAWRELAADRPLPPLPSGGRPVVVSAAEATSAAVRKVRDAVVEIRSDDRWTGVGVFVAKRLILTKASELGPNVTAYLRNNIPASVDLVTTDREHDLAILRVRAGDLTDGIEPVVWADVTDLPVGTPVAAAMPADFTPPAGIVSVAAREIPGLKGGLAVRIKSAQGGLEVTELIDELNEDWMRVEPQLLRVGDVITRVGGASMVDEDAYRKRLGDKPDGLPRLLMGDLIKVSIRRDGAIKEITTRLRPAGTTILQLLYSCSYRYTGFPSAFACDFLARPEHCGAPVVDADGRLVGLLVARAQYIESLVIPASEVKSSLKRMMPKVFAKP